MFVRVGHDDNLGALRILVNQLQPRDRTGKSIAFGDVLGIVQVQEAIQRLQCQDPRDKVFAIINLFGSSCTIKPDYGSSCFRLALRVLEEYAACDNNGRCVELAAYLCHNLRLDLTAVDVQVALAENQARLSIKRDDTGYTLPRSISGTTTLQQITPMACQVLPDKTGNMAAPFISSPSPHSDNAIDGRTIVVNHQPVAKATCNFATGDWIAPLSHYVSDYYRSYCVGLVFRLREGNTYGVVGEVSFSPSCRPCVSWDTCGCQFGREFHTHYATDFTVTFDPEELLLFSIRIREPYRGMRQESQHGGRGGLRVPAGPALNWMSSSGIRRDSTKPVRMYIP